LSVSRIKETIAKLLEPDDVLWQGASGCGTSFSTTEIVLELLEEMKKGNLDFLLIRLDGSLFRIVKVGDKFDTEHVPLPDQKLESLFVHLTDEQYREKKAVLVLEFMSRELHAKIEVNLTCTDRLVSILYVMSTRAVTQTLRSLRDAGVGTFHVEPPSDAVLEAMARAQYDFDPDSCYWARNPDDPELTLDLDAALMVCETRRLKMGNIPRHVFATITNYNSAERDLLQMDPAALYHMNFLDPSHVLPSSHFFVSPRFKAGVTSSLVQKYRDAAPLLYKQTKTESSLGRALDVCTASLWLNTWNYKA
jgi:hypothetical protein